MPCVVSTIEPTGICVGPESGTKPDPAACTPAAAAPGGSFTRTTPRSTATFTVSPTTGGGSGSGGISGRSTQIRAAAALARTTLLNLASTQRGGGRDPQLGQRTGRRRQTPQIAEQNLARVAAGAYDAVLAEHDLLVMPTLPLKATPIPAADAPLEEQVARALEMIPNTAPFDVSGHPAITVPAGLADGLPVGMMIIAKRFDDATCLRVAHPFEPLCGGFPAPPARAAAHTPA